jgi:imidazole glycerol-phosphate synthase subunit HisH
MSLVVIDYGIGNTGSVMNMLKKLGAAATLTGDPEAVRRASRLILPGVGAFDAGMQNLHARGLVDPLEDAVGRRGVPILGFCLGMQLMVESSEEGEEKGLGWMHGTCVRLSPAGDLRVPQMAWNRLQVRRPHPVLDDLVDDSRFYFVHSYRVECTDIDDVAAVVDYGGEVSAVIARNNLIGTQFHPEKSHRYGMRLLSNFLAWQGSS